MSIYHGKRDEAFEMIEYDFSRLLSTMLNNKQEIDCFEYPYSLFPSGNKSVLCVLGCDHGGGSNKLPTIFIKLT